MRRWLAGAALVGLGFLASPSAVPVYDGVGSPDEPYKSVGTTNAPQPASSTVAVQSGASAGLQVKSSETGPQVLLDLGPGAFKAPSAFTVSATPLAADGTPPRGTIDGNVYRVAVTDGATIDPDNIQGFLFLRAKVMTQPDPVVVFRPTATEPWVEQKTQRSGRDVLYTPFRKLGDYAVVQLPGSKPLSSGGLSATRVALLVGGVVLLLVITVLVLRRPRADDD